MNVIIKYLSNTFVHLTVTAVHCDSLEGQIDSKSHLTARIEGTRLGQTAVFQCPIGYKLNGTANLTCQASGNIIIYPHYCHNINVYSILPFTPNIITYK